MGNPYSGEWQKINKIANDVNILNVKIQQLEVQRSNLYAQLSSIPYETDEEGNDVNAGKRNALYAQIESVNGLIDEANQRKQELSSSAYELASNYRQQAAGFREKASKAYGASSQFQKLSGYRFGASTASAGVDLAQQRMQHYEDYVTILSDLVEAAELAAEGTSSAANTQSISERGTFKNPNAIYNGASSANSKTNNADTESVWSGKEGNSIKSAKDDMASSTLSQLGVSGIPYTNGIPNFDAVSHAKVGTAMAGVGMVAAADAMLAKKFGTTGEEIANYRNENGLEWRDDGTGQNANLIPKSISNEYSDGKMSVSEPTPMEALTAYMCAHNYGKDDYEIYSKDPEWQKLHQAVFPECHQIADHELTPDEKIDWICDIIPNVDRGVAKQVVTSMEHYSGMGYSTIHWDKEGKLSETKDILRVFDSNNVQSYKGPIYRGLSFGSKKEIVKVLKQYRGVWKEPGITSFSASKDIAEKHFAQNNSWGLVLTCNNNKSAIPFRHISKSSWEDEVLSPGGHRNSGWKIDYNSVQIDENNHMFYVDIEEI